MSSTMMMLLIEGSEDYDPMQEVSDNVAGGRSRSGTTSKPTLPLDD